MEPDCLNKTKLTFFKINDVGWDKRQMLTRGESGETGSSTHTCDLSQRQTRIDSFQTTVGPELELGDCDGSSDFIKDGLSDGDFERDGEYDCSRVGLGDFVGASDWG